MAATADAGSVCTLSASARAARPIGSLPVREGAPSSTDPQKNYAVEHAGKAPPTARANPGEFTSTGECCWPADMYPPMTSSIADETVFEPRGLNHEL
jgi:hypothetical protein